MMIAAAFRCIGAMGDFDKIWLLTAGGPGDRTTTITLYTYKTGFSAFDIGRTAAIAWIFVIVVLAVSSPLLRYLFKTASADDR
jgi:multiple sugar transport system permease protein